MASQCLPGSTGKRVFSSQYARHERGNENEIVISATRGKLTRERRTSVLGRKGSGRRRNDDISIRSPSKKKKQGTPSFLIDTMDGKFRDSLSLGKTSIERREQNKKKKRKERKNESALLVRRMSFPIVVCRCAACFHAF